MRPKSALKKLDALLKRPYFTSQQAKLLGVSAATLSHYVKSGELVRLGHGIYRGVNSPTITDVRWEDLAYAIARVKGGVICLVSALAFYDLTDEIPRQHWIAVHNATRHRADSDIKIVRMRNISLGKVQQKINGIKLPIFDRERTIVDAFRYLSIETALKSLRFALEKKGKEKIDIKKLRQYSKKLRVNIEPYLLGEML